MGHGVIVLVYRTRHGRMKFLMGLRPRTIARPPGSPSKVRAVARSS